MQKLSFTNSKNQSVTFDLTPPYIFWQVSGLSTPSAFAITTQAPGQHGHTMHNLLLDSRIITLSAHVHGKSGKAEMYKQRQKLNAICNPVLGEGTILYENDSAKYIIPAYCKAIDYNDKLQNIQTLTIEFECPSPFWLSAEKSIDKLAYVSGGLNFPLNSPCYFGMLGYSVVIDNNGDGILPLEFYIDGGAVNPQIINESTGEFIKIEKPVSSSDRIYINTNPESLEVSILSVNPETNEKVKTNAYGYLSTDSTLLQLGIGKNKLTFKSEDENKNIRLSIIYQKRYVGV